MLDSKTVLRGIRWLVIAASVSGCAAALGVHDIPEADEGGADGSTTDGAVGNDAMDGPGLADRAADQHVADSGTPGETGTTCSASTCGTGCCGSDGQCHMEESATNCGTGGGVCKACTASSGMACVSSKCGCGTDTDCGSGVCDTTNHTCGAPVCNGTCGGTGCTHFTCIAAAPAGWTGPFQLYEGPPSQTPTCPAPTTDQTFAGNLTVSQTPAQCSTCTCGTPGAPLCEVASLGFNPGGSCGTQYQVLMAGENTSPCMASFQLSSHLSSIHSGYQGSVSSNTGYSCPPSAQSPVIPPVSWTTVGTGCSEPFPQAEGCASGNLCVPIPSAPFQQHLCISQSGTPACPAPYVNATTFYGGANDMRGCSGCACTPNTITCTGTLSVYSDSACSNQVFSTSFPGTDTCTPVNANSSNSYWYSSLSNVSFQGAISPCTAAGGQPTGTIAPTMPLTVCCTP